MRNRGQRSLRTGVLSFHLIPNRSGDPISRSHLAVPMTGVLDCPLLVLLEVDKDDTKTLGIAFSPLEVVHQAPEMIRPDRDSVGDRPVQLLQMASDVGNASIITDPTVRPWAYIIGAAVLGNLNGDVACDLPHPDQDLMQPAWIDVPANVRLLVRATRND